MKYRVRIVFNAPVDREHPFVSVPKDTLEAANQLVEDMRPAIVHAVSVTIQRLAHDAGLRAEGWETISLLSSADLTYQMGRPEPGTLRS